MNAYQIGGPVSTRSRASFCDYNSSMEFYLNDPEVERVAPEATRILDLRAEPYPDGIRLRVALDLTPFQKRPDIEFVLTDAEGHEAGSASVVEPVAWKLELTLHNRKAGPTAGQYSLRAQLSYPELGKIDQREVTIMIPSSTK